MNIWGLSSLGRRMSGDISAPRGAKTEVLLFLHDVRTSTTEDIAAHCGMTRTRAGSILRSLKRSGLVKELTPNA